MVIRQAVPEDIPAMVALSYTKRRNYEKSQPQFWRYAEGAEAGQGEWFKTLLANARYIFFVAEQETAIMGFAIGNIVKSPEVYDAGLTLMVDDFCVTDPTLWGSVGAQLLAALKAKAHAKGVTQTVVVCGAHDAPKRQCLQGIGLTVASEWYVGKIT